MAFRHVGRAVVDAGADRKDDGDRRQPGQHGHRSALVAAKPLQLIERTIDHANSFEHLRSPKNWLPVAPSNGSAHADPVRAIDALSKVQSLKGP